MFPIQRHKKIHHHRPDELVPPMDPPNLTVKEGYGKAVPNYPLQARHPNWPKAVKIVEVGLRDGLQNEPVSYVEDFSQRQLYNNDAFII